MVSHLLPFIDAISIGVHPVDFTVLFTSAPLLISISAILVRPLSAATYNALKMLRKNVLLYLCLNKILAIFIFYPTSLVQIVAHDLHQHRFGLADPRLRFDVPKRLLITESSLSNKKNSHEFHHNHIKLFPFLIPMSSSRLTSAPAAIMSFASVKLPSKRK